MAACWKDFLSHLVLESHHQEVLGQVAGDEDMWAPLVYKLPLRSHCWLKARNEWLMMEKMSVYLMYWLFALQPVLSMSISEVITNNNYIHGLCFHIKSQIRSGFALTSKAIQPDVSWLGMYIFKDAICGRRRGVFVHITANLVWLLGSPADIWVVFTPYALDEVGIFKSAHNSQDDYVFIILLCVSVWLCLCVQFQQSSLCR